MKTNRTKNRTTVLNELQSSEQWKAFDNLIEGCQIIGTDWTYRYLNKTAVMHARQPLKNLLGRTMMECYPGIETTSMFTVLQKCMKDRTYDALENEFTFPDGSKGWFELRIEPVEEGLLILSFDITQRKRSERRIQHLTRLYATLSQINQTIVRTRERETLFHTICTVAVEFGKFELAWIGLVNHNTGTVTPAAVYGNAKDHIPFQNINYKQMPFKNALIGKAVTTNSVMYCKDIQKDPTMVHWHSMAKQFNFHSSAVIPFSVNNEVVGFVKLYSSDVDFFESGEQLNLLKEMSLDISFALEGMKNEQERKLAEEELTKSEKRFSTMFHHCPAWMVLTHPQTGITYEVNKAWEDFTGYTRDEAIGKHVVNLGIYNEEKWNAIVAEVETKKEIKNRETQIQTRNGEIRTALISRELIRILEEDYILSMGIDITDRKQAIERALELAERNQALVHALGQIVYEWFPKKNKIQWTGEFTKVLGYQPHEIGETTESWFSRIHPDDRDHVWHQIERAQREKKNYDDEYRFLRKDGSYQWMHDSGILYFSANGELERVVGVFYDITERKKLEEQYLRAQRMESVGTLAGGIAHDLNNILAPIMLSLQFLKKKYTDPADEKMLDMLALQAQRGADLVKQVLAFARGTELQRTVIQLRHLITELQKFTRNTFPANITIETIIPQNLWTILGDPTQVHQVLLNLCVNARDAMPQGGTLTIEAENALLDEQYVRMNPAANVGPYVVIKVKDNGSGMSQDILKKIFEPFFTTKEIGKGTGLGLSTVYTIVKEHGGFVNVYSEVGKGTEFRVYLPATQTSETKLAQETIKLRTQGNGELILFVDDEEAVLEIAKVSLELSNYRVLVAHDGTEAIGMFAQHQQQINLVITDMNMPFMDGPSLIRALRKLDPQLRIIGSSGLADKAKLAEAQSLGTNDFLSKPFTTDKLLETIANVLSK